MEGPLPRRARAEGGGRALPSSVVSRWFHGGYGGETWVAKDLADPR